MLIFYRVDVESVLRFESVECLLVKMFEILEVIGVGGGQPLLRLTCYSLAHLLSFTLPSSHYFIHLTAVGVL